MQLPTVRELARRLEPVTPDPFIEPPDPPAQARALTPEDARAAAAHHYARSLEEE